MDFEEETVEEDIVTEGGGMRFLFGVDVAAGFAAGRVCLMSEGWGLGMMTSWWTGLRISST